MLAYTSSDSRGKCGTSLKKRLLAYPHLKFQS